MEAPVTARQSTGIAAEGPGAEALVAQAAALEAVMRQHNQRLYRPALSLVGNPDDAEDVLQDAYFHAFKKRASFAGRSGLGAWLATIVRNQALTATVRKVLRSWGPGKFDAELLMDGKAFRPDGKSAATLIPPAFGLAGVNLHTWTGWGSVTHWNGFVANLEMQGSGTFYDPRLNDAAKFPIAAQAGFGDVRKTPDLVTSKLAPLHLYQLSLEAPRAPAGSFDAASARRGKALFEGKADCARCHVPPLFTEPGWNMHTPAEIGIDSFQADRSPDGHYRTAPLKGLWTHSKGGYYHDGRFPSLTAVVTHYERTFSLGLTAAERRELIEYLKSL